MDLNLNQEYLKDSDEIYVTRSKEEYNWLMGKFELHTEIRWAHGKTIFEFDGYEEEKRDSSPEAVIIIIRRGLRLFRGNWWRAFESDSRYRYSGMKTTEVGDIMSYDVGETVVLRGDIQVGDSYGNIYVSERLRDYIGEEVTIIDIIKSYPKGYEVRSEGGTSAVADKMIDHEATAELPKESKPDISQVSILHQYELIKPSLEITVDSLREVIDKNNREISWKESDIEQWEESIVEAQQFISRMEVRNESLEYAIQILQYENIGTLVIEDYVDETTGLDKGGEE